MQSLPPVYSIFAFAPLFSGLPVVKPGFAYRQRGTGLIASVQPTCIPSMRPACAAWWSLVAAALRRELMRGI